MTDSTKYILDCFGEKLSLAAAPYIRDLTEIRIRADRPVVIYIKNRPYAVLSDTTVSPLNKLPENPLIISANELKTAFAHMCEYSVYKHQNDINSGFITVRGGHRIGLCGTAVILNNEIKTVSELTSLNIRIAAEYLGCADEFFKLTDFENGVLICGVPCSGKTTLLRDIARQLTVMYFHKVSVIDERLEISSMYRGRTPFDLGLSDIYCGYPKLSAIIQSIRTMSPDYIVCDELTGSDAQGVLSAVNFGVKLLASVHCDSVKNAVKNPSIMKLLKTGAFQKVVFLDELIPCKIKEIYDPEDLKCLK